MSLYEINLITQAANSLIWPDYHGPLVTIFTGFHCYYFLPKFREVLEQFFSNLSSLSKHHVESVNEKVRELGINCFEPKYWTPLRNTNCAVRMKGKACILD